MFESVSAAALLSLFIVVYCKIGDAAGGEWSIRGLGVGVRRGERGRSSGIVVPRRAERGGGDEQNKDFGEDARAADAANPLRMARDNSGKTGCCLPRSPLDFSCA